MRIELTEYQTQRLTPEELPSPEGLELWRRFGKQIQVEFPSPKTNGLWELTSQGWVGSIALTPELHLHIQPKAPLQNLFRMWAYAYKLQSFHLLDGLIELDSIDDFYAQLALVLARRVLMRARQGLQRAYVPKHGRIPAIRGQIDLKSALRRPTHTELICRYAEQTTDIDDNQILAFTLEQIARGRRCPEAVQTTVRRAYQAVSNVATPYVITPDMCNGRFYTRLNQDYAPMHALCRFFLSHTGPAHSHGQAAMLPFLVDMARLYELFVAEWMCANLPAGWQIRAQERVQIGPRGSGLQFDIDLVLYTPEGRPFAVLDTKYKSAKRADNADVSQIIAYAKAKGCRQAALIYPLPLSQPLDVEIDGLRLRSLTFGLDGNLETAGQALMSEIIA